MTTSPTRPHDYMGDPGVDPEDRPDAGELTLAEKVAQLGSVWLGIDVVTGEVALMQDVFSRRLTWLEVAADGIGAPHHCARLGTQFDAEIAPRIATAANGAAP